MPYVKVTAVVASKCSVNTIGYQTDPVIDAEVLKEAKNYIDSHAKLSISLDGDTVVVSGKVFPPTKTLAEETSKILSHAHDAVEQRHKLEEANHNSLVDQYAKAAGLPVV